jgi:subtilisin family serine protease
MSGLSKLALDHPSHKLDNDYYQMTGTSMSAAQVSGVVALMLAARPDLTPDQVKYRLMASARPATITLDGKEQLAYSLWQQGSRRLDA